MDWLNIRKFIAGFGRRQPQTSAKPAPRTLADSAADPADVQWSKLFRYYPETSVAFQMLRHTCPELIPNITVRSGNHAITYSLALPSAAQGELLPISATAELKPNGLGQLFQVGHGGGALTDKDGAQALYDYARDNGYITIDRHTNEMRKGPTIVHRRPEGPPKLRLVHSSPEQ